MSEEYNVIPESVEYNRLDFYRMIKGLSDNESDLPSKLDLLRQIGLGSSLKDLL